MTPRVIFTPSAEKHGISREDIVWAIMHPFVTHPVDDRKGTGMVTTLYLGPMKPPSTRRKEVLASLSKEDATMVIFHAMQMRSKYQHLLDQQWEDS